MFNNPRWYLEEIKDNVKTIDNNIQSTKFIL